MMNAKRQYRIRSGNNKSQGLKINPKKNKIDDLSSRLFGDLEHEGNIDKKFDSLPQLGAGKKDYKSLILKAKKHIYEQTGNKKHIPAVQSDIPAEKIIMPPKVNNNAYKKKKRSKKGKKRQGTKFSDVDIDFDTYLTGVGLQMKKLPEQNPEPQNQEDPEDFSTMYQILDEIKQDVKRSRNGFTQELDDLAEIRRMLGKVDSELSEHGPGSLSMTDHFVGIHRNLRSVGARLDNKIVEEIEKDKKDILQKRFSNKKREDEN